MRRGGGGGGRGRDVNLPAWMTAAGRGGSVAPATAPQPGAGAGTGIGSRGGADHALGSGSGVRRPLPPGERDEHPRAKRHHRVETAGSSGEAPARERDGASSAAQSSWEYVDSSGATQGPFTTEQMRGWLQAGFFQPGLQVRRLVTALRPPGSGGGSTVDIRTCPEFSAASTVTPTPPAVTTAAAGSGTSAAASQTEAKAVGKKSTPTPASEEGGAAPAARVPLPPQGTMFAQGQAEHVMKGGTAVTAEGHALFLMQKMRQFEEASVRSGLCTLHACVTNNFRGV
jgi:hypothetical protein